MAEVMNDLSDSNDELRETNGNHRLNDGKLNGPGDDRDDESECNNVSKDVASSPITKKQVADLAVEKLFELSDKNAAASGPVANGHLKGSSDSSRTSSTSCENTKDSTTSGDDAAADSSSSSVREENERHDKVAGSLRPEDFDAHDAVLNLKTNANRCNQDATECVKVDGDSTSKTDGVSSDEATLSQCESSTDENDGAKVEKNRDECDDFGPSDSTSDKQNGKKMKKLPASTTITPRRSSRNLNKPRSYNEKDLELAAEELIDESSPSNSKRPKREDNDIEEITPSDPLADVSKGGRLRGGGSSVSVSSSSKTIVVSDTKGLVEFASSTKASRSNKKEPTLVIIDTNSILSGRGPVPVSTPSNSPMLHSSPVSTPISMLPISASALAARGVPSSTSAFSVIPIELSTPNAYTPYKSNNPPPQMKPLVIGPASSTTGASSPITLQASSVSITTVPSSSVSLASKQAQQLPQPPPPLQQQHHQLQQPSSVLPSLTDDMFVVEAPSFIVPYVYEKPPMGSLKEYTVKLERELEELEEEEKRREREKREKEDAEKQKNADTTATADAGSEDVEMKDASDDKKTTSEADSTVAEEKTALEQEKEDGVESKESTTTTTSEKPSETEKKDESSSTKEDKKAEDLRKPLSYFDNPLGKFFMQIGLNLVQEHVQTDLLRSQKRKRDKEGDKCSPEVQAAIETLQKTLESSKENNDPFKLSLRKCELCSFKTESTLVMAHHLETPHMKNYTYRCNFCPLEVRSPHDILFHMEAEHNVRGRLERAPAFHQCPNCPFEDNQKGKLTRHLVSCLKKYRPERNQEPPLDWEPPAKIPRVTRNRPPPMTPNNAVYQAAMSGLKQVQQNSLLPKLIPNANTVPNMKHGATSMSNKRQQQPMAMPASNYVNRFSQPPNQPSFPPRSISVTNQNQGVMYRPPNTNSAAQVLFAQNYQLSGAQIYQQNANSKQQSQPSLAAAKLLNQPSISITPLPRQSSSTPSLSGSSNFMNSSKSSAKASSTNQNNKNSFVVCEICDGYIKDLEQLRNHMQWIHKVKIHPKMIYNRPPLNCQKCQFRFFTDQGLERHLLGSHGLVTSSMQEAANKGKDNGRCPICGRVYQWKLLNHVARDHQMALKPAHLSYKCTVCTATFGMYKQFESHVYSAHSVVAKRAMDTKKPPVIPSSSVSQSEALLKPLKINDEITIIPQPIRTSKTNNKPNMPLCLPKSSLATISTTIKKDPPDMCWKEDCTLEQFEREEQFNEHKLHRHVRPFRIKINLLDMDKFVPVPNETNKFYLSRDRAECVRLGAKEFQIKLANLVSLQEDCVYRVIENGKTKTDSAPCEQNIEPVKVNGARCDQNIEKAKIDGAPCDKNVTVADRDIFEPAIKLSTPNATYRLHTVLDNRATKLTVAEDQREEASDNDDILNGFLQTQHFLCGSTTLPVVSKNPKPATRFPRPRDCLKPPPVSALSFRAAGTGNQPRKIVRLSWPNSVPPPLTGLSPQRQNFIHRVFPLPNSPTATSATTGSNAVRGTPNTIRMRSVNVEPIVKSVTFASSSASDSARTPIVSCPVPPSDTTPSAVIDLRSDDDAESSSSSSGSEDSSSSSNSTDDIQIIEDIEDPLKTASDDILDSNEIEIVEERDPLAIDAVDDLSKGTGFEDRESIKIVGVNSDSFDVLDVIELIDDVD